MQRIFLIGFMGSGKSTLGKRLASKLEIPFIDLDTEIASLENASIDCLFEQKGEAYFRKVESEVLRTTTQSNESFVLAVGGGTPCFKDNMKHIKQQGTSIYLKYNSGILHSRLVEAKIKRPLLKDKTSEELKMFIESKLKEREEFYLQADYIAESNNLTVEGLLSLIQ